MNTDRRRRKADGDRLHGRTFLLGCLHHRLVLEFVLHFLLRVFGRQSSARTTEPCSFHQSTCLLRKFCERHFTGQENTMWRVNSTQIDFR